MKTTPWLLKTIRAVLNICWYGGIALAIFAFCALTFKVCTSKYTEFSNPVKYPQIPTVTLLHSTTADAYNISLQADQATLKMYLANNFINVSSAYFFLLAFEALVLSIIYQLRKFFGTIEQNAPFTHENVRRLKTTALCFALTTVLNILLGYSSSLIIYYHVKEKDMMNMVWSESFTGVLLGAAIYILADVFKYGFELKKEIGEFV